MGEQNVSCDFGGGENVPWSALSKTGFGGLRKWDLPGLCRFPLRKTPGRKTNGGGGETYHRCGGPKPFLGRGLMVCFSPPPEFSTPLCFSLTLGPTQKVTFQLLFRYFNFSQFRAFCLAPHITSLDFRRSLKINVFFAVVLRKKKKKKKQNLPNPCHPADQLQVSLGPECPGERPRE